MYIYDANKKFSLIIKKGTFNLQFHPSKVLTIFNLQLEIITNVEDREVFFPL